MDNNLISTVTTASNVQFLKKHSQGIQKKKKESLEHLKEK